jgi:tRNA (mo5U34)-methyltransferase
VNTDSADLAETVARYAWYHTQDLGNGVVTKGMFDHRPFLGRFPLPADLSGMRCLDVGTMDGFWAFEMERRGAADVVALDLEDPDKLDWPVLVKPKVPNKTLDESKEFRFELVRNALGSHVRRVLGSVYELTADFGRFDLVFCGDLLLHLKDPISALEAIHSVTGDRAIVCTPVIKRRRWSKQPLAQFDGIDVFQWWIPNDIAFERWVRAAGFARVEMSPTFEVPLTDGMWRGLRGVATGYVS